MDSRRSDDEPSPREERFDSLAALLIALTHAQGASDTHELDGGRARLPREYVSDGVFRDFLELQQVARALGMHVLVRHDGGSAWVEVRRGAPAAAGESVRQVIRPPRAD